MNKSLITIAVALALGSWAMLGQAAESKVSADPKSGSKVTAPAVAPAKTNIEAKQPRQSRQVPAASVPGTQQSMPMNQGVMQDHNAARAAREMQQLQKLQEAQRAMQPGNRAASPNNDLGMSGRDGNSLRDRAAGGSNPSSRAATNSGSGSAGAHPGGPVNHNTGPADYRAGMANSASSQRRGGFNSQPSSSASGMTKGDRSAVADETRVSHATDQEGNKYTITTTERDDGSTTSHVEVRNPQTNEPVHSSVAHVQPDGSSTIKSATRDSDGSTSFVDSVLDANGNPDPKHPPNARTVDPRAHGPSGQSGENDSSVRGNDNCNWNPVWGRCMKQQTSHKDMTRQPGQDQEGSASLGGGFAGRLGNEAVTNPGDADWNSNRPGGSGGGGLIDMRDPSIGSPGGEGTGSPD